MSERPHGTRASYERGCRCTPCKAANATYWTNWRRTRKAGKLPLGALIPAVDAQRLIRLIVKEWKIRRARVGRPGLPLALAAELGQHGNLARLTTADMIKLRTWLKIRRFYRLRVALPDQHHRSPDLFSS